MIAAIAFGLILGCTTACAPGDAAISARAWVPPRSDSILGVDSAAITAAIRRRVMGERPRHLPAEHWKHIQRLYEAYGNTSLWFGPGGLDERRVTGLLKALIDASTDALHVDEYSLDDVGRAVTAIRGTSRSTADEIAAADVLLSTAYVALASDLLSGQLDPRSLSQAWYVRLGQERLDSAVARSLREESLDSALARMRPSDSDYAALRGELAHLRKIVAGGGWVRVPAGRSLKPGDVDSATRLVAIRRRLAGQGFTAAAAPPSAAPRPRARAGPDSGIAFGAILDPDMAVYDSALAGAVARFQSHHGIVVDSVLGPETLTALNVPATYRLGQIAANLERYRWLPHSLGDRYVLVNVPAFRLEAHDSGGKSLEMKVIVGQEYQGRRTPVFADSMEYVVFRPYWMVPPNIQAKELGPRIAANPGIMSRDNYEYYTENGRTRIRQRPGDRNALGLVKFIFPNDFNIYLHDTPMDELFTEDIRAFSHGCIRLEKPELLAEWVLGWTPEQVRDAEQGKDDHRVNLPKKIPVYIAYFTTYVREGRLFFGNDLYSRDDVLVKAVTPGAFPNAEAERAIEALRKLVE